MTRGEKILSHSQRAALSFEDDKSEVHQKFGYEEEEARARNGRERETGREEMRETVRNFEESGVRGVEKICRMLEGG